MILVSDENVQTPELMFWKTGNITPGMEADLVGIDLASTPAIAQREAHAEDVWETIFPTIMMGDDRAVAEVWIGGRQAA